MIDKTTEGVTAEPAEVQAVLQSLCGYHLAERDAVYRYTMLTQEQVLYDALVQAIRRERGRALADLVAAGHTAAQVAAMTNLGTRQRVRRLIALANAPGPRDVEEKREVEERREFDEKLAAVEATLDEVVSGLVPVGDTPPPVPAQRAPFEDVQVEGSGWRGTRQTGAA
jgi:hypothetical protein